MAPKKRSASKTPAAPDAKAAKTTVTGSINVDHMAEVGLAWERVMAYLANQIKLMFIEE